MAGNELRKIITLCEKEIKQNGFKKLQRDPAYSSDWIKLNADSGDAEDVAYNIGSILVEAGYDEQEGDDDTITFPLKGEDDEILDEGFVFKFYELRDPEIVIISFYYTDYLD